MTKKELSVYIVIDLIWLLGVNLVGNLIGYCSTSTKGWVFLGVLTGIMVATDCILYVIMNKLESERHKKGCKAFLLAFTIIVLCFMWIVLRSVAWRAELLL